MIRKDTHLTTARIARQLVMSGRVALASALLLTATASAQAPQAPAVNRGGAASTNTPGAVQGSLTEQIIRGRVQLEAGNAAAQTTLQNAAQQSLVPLINVAGPEILTKDPNDMPRTPAFGVVARQAAEAHYWWGVAADRFANRNAAITAFARSIRFAMGDRSGNFSAAREAMPNIRGLLAEGLPVIAPDDTLESISSLVHADPVMRRRLWTPLRFTFNIPDAVFTPGAVAGKKQIEFLLTDGKLFVSPSRRDPRASLSQVPPPFREVEADALPSVLKMSTIVVGFVREIDGPNRGMWRQVVRVHYPHPSSTKNNRDDLPRAEALCLQFLKVHTLTRMALGVENPYSTAFGSYITTLWLSEVSALWPRDEDDPAVLASLGMVYMPKVNIPNTSRPIEIKDVEISPMSRPWLAAGQILDGSAPGDFIFYKVAEPRSEAEWLREVAHEYGHVTIPPFNGFRPPLEPFGNGHVGETLNMLWAAAAPQEFDAPLQQINVARSTSPAARPGMAATTGGAAVQPITMGDAGNMPTFARELESHVAANALLCLNAWNAQGPGSALRRDSSLSGLQYLQGLATYIERVYGNRVLSEAFRPLPRTATLPEPPQSSLPTVAIVGAGNTGSTAVGAGNLSPGAVVLPTPPPPPPLQSTALLDGMATALRSGFADNQNRLPIWLPAALVTPETRMSAMELIHRAPVGLKARERATAWLYVPADATTLRIEWKTAPGAAPLLVEGGWKYAPLPPTAAGATHAARIETGGRPGWQRFAFTAPVDLNWSAAWFEKANQANPLPAPASGTSAPRR